LDGRGGEDEGAVGDAENLKGISGVSIEFKRDASREFTDAALNELGTVIVPKNR
jgi:hypothetical protein